jgi:ABC-type branched-subunit amino acid transport system substrate-binding protein
VPEIRWARLVSPHGAKRRFGRVRPPYDEALLARALRDGLDSAGEPLDVTMPRYVIGDAEIADLVEYLRVVGTEPEIGTTPVSIRIGALLPLSGPLAAQGRSIAGVLSRRIDAANAEGGAHGRRIELDVRDAGDSPASAVAAARELVSGTSPVFACVGNGGRGADSAVSAMLDAASVPVIGPLGFAPDDVTRGAVYWLLPSLESQARAAAVRLVRNAGASVRVLAGASDDAARVAAAFAEAARSRGARVTTGSLGAVRSEDVGECDLLALLGGAAEIGPRAGAAASRAGGAPEIVVSSVLLGGPPPRGSGSRVHVVSPPIGPGLSSPGFEDFERIRAGAPAAAMEMAAYAAATTLVEALKAAGREVTRDRVRVALEDEIHDLRTGVLPPLRFGPLRRDGARGALLATYSAAGALESAGWIPPANENGRE